MGCQISSDTFMSQCVRASKGDTMANLIIKKVIKLKTLTNTKLIPVTNNTFVSNK